MVGVDGDFGKVCLRFGEVFLVRIFIVIGEFLNYIFGLDIIYIFELWLVVFVGVVRYRGVLSLIISGNSEMNEYWLWM